MLAREGAQELLTGDQQQNDHGNEEEVEEEGFAVESLIRLVDCDGIVKDRVLPHVTLGVLVVEIDDEAEWPSGESLVGGEGVVEGGLAFGLHDAIVHSSREILDVEGKVLGITEGSVERLDQELFASFVGEPDVESD